MDVIHFYEKRDFIHYIFTCIPLFLNIFLMVDLMNTDIRYVCLSRLAKNMQSFLIGNCLSNSYMMLISFTGVDLPH